MVASMARIHPEYKYGSCDDGPAEQKGRRGLPRSVRVLAGSEGRQGADWLGLQRV